MLDFSYLDLLPTKLQHLEGQSHVLGKDSPDKPPCFAHEAVSTPDSIQVQTGVDAKTGTRRGPS